MHMTIKLYIGAHKTATTHIQSLLEYNKETLVKSQIKLSTPTSLRKSWLNDFLKYCHKNEKTNITKLQNEAPTNGIWILSDENIVGTPYEFMISNKGMYPNIKKRLQALKKLFPIANIEIFFAIRSYEKFYRSTYLEVVRNRGYIPFEEYYQEEKFMKNSWIDVIKMFTETIPQENITLWCYEDIDTLMPHIINRMTEQENAKELIAKYPIKKTRESLSSKTIEVLASLSSEMTQKESKKIIETLNKKYPLGEQYSKFIPFTTKTSRIFQEKYKHDINFIKHNYQQINFI